MKNIYYIEMFDIIVTYLDYNIYITINYLKLTWFIRVHFYFLRFKYVILLIIL